jgi:23S rRNA pseudouridine2457 synthase
MAKLIRFYKPYGVMCQFRASGERLTLKDFIDDPSVHPAGRLDFDSEGLVLLTDDGTLQARISQPRFKLPKTYLVLVEGVPDASTRSRVVHGVELRDGKSRADRIDCIDPPPVLPAYGRPLPAHRLQNSSWLRVVMTSGRNREVRRLLAAVGHPVLRLVRTRIGPWTIDGLTPGEAHVERVHLGK